MARLDYKLDDLEWEGFEKLVQTLLKARLGLGVEAWGGHGDWGRDAYFEGTLKYPTDEAREGSFVFQCKFVVGANAAGAKSVEPLLSSVRKECARIRAKQDVSEAWATPPTCYALFTNAPVSPSTRVHIMNLLAQALPHTKVCIHDGQDVCQWLRLSPEVAESFPQFHSNSSTLRPIVRTTLVLVLLLVLLLCGLWLHQQRGQQLLNARMGALEETISSQVGQLPPGESRPQINFPLALRDWAGRYGITPEKAAEEVHAWIAEVRRKRTDLTARARAEFLAQHFAEAARLSDDAADTKILRSRELFHKGRQIMDEAVADLHRAGVALIADGRTDEALIRLKRALEHSPQEIDQDRWANLQNLVAICHTELGMRIGGAAASEHLRSAVESFREASKAWRREQSMQAWAMTQNNLGIVLRLQALQSRGPDVSRLLSESVDILRGALKTRTREHQPIQWAFTQVNIGNALVDQARSSGLNEALRLLAESAAAFREASKVLTAERFPHHWAMTQHNLGLVLQNQAQRSDPLTAERLLNESLSMFRNALRIFDPKNFPFDWALTQRCLGDTLRAQSLLSDVPRGEPLIAAAVSAYREALKIFSHERFPQQWAVTQDLLGVALYYQARRSGPEAVRLLSDSASATREALRIFTREHFPQDWAETQYNLANALREHSIRTQGAEAVQLLRQAVEAYRAALEVFTASEFPFQNSMVIRNLGPAEMALRHQPE